VSRIAHELAEDPRAAVGSACRPRACGSSPQRSKRRPDPLRRRHRRRWSRSKVKTHVWGPDRRRADRL